MRSQSLRSKSLSLLATSALTLLLCSGSFDISKVHASQTAFSREELKTILELKKGTNKDRPGKPMSDSEAQQIVLNDRRSPNNTNSGGGGGMDSNQKIEYEKKLEESKRLQEEQAKKIAEQKEQAERLQKQTDQALKEKEEAEKEAAKKAEEHKKKLLEEQDNRKILEDKLKQQIIEHDKVLKSIQETHSKNVDIEKKQVEKLQIQLNLNLRSQVFQGKPFLEEKLEEVEKRLDFLDTLDDQSNELKEFIGISRDSLKAFKQQADNLDPNGDQTDLLDFQKKVVNFNYEFAVADLRFITQRANKSGMDLPDGWESLSNETQEEMMKGFHANIQAKADEKKKKDEADKVEADKLRVSVPKKAKEAFDKYTIIINSKKYLKDELGKVGPMNALLTGLNGLKAIAEFRDYATANLGVLDAKNKDIVAKTTILDKRIEFLTNSQHPETATPEMIDAASALYMSADFPGTKNIAAVDKNSNKIKAGQDFRRLFADRLKSDIGNVPLFLGLVNAKDEVIQGYLDDVLKTAPKKKSFENLRKAFGEGFKEIYNGTLDPNKAYAYYLVVNAFVPVSGIKGHLENFNLSWQTDPQKMLNSIKRVIDYIETEVVLPETQKAQERARSSALNKQNTGGAAAEQAASTATKNKGDIFDRFLHDDGLDNNKLSTLWKNDPDLKKIANEAKVETFAKEATGLPNLLNAIVDFMAKNYDKADAQAIRRKLAAMDAGEGVTNVQLIANLKDVIKEIIADATGGNAAEIKKTFLENIPTQALSEKEYQEAVLIFSHLLDDETHLKGLQDLKKKLENGGVQSNKDLAADLKGVVLAALQSITKNNPVIVEVTNVGTGNARKPIFRFDFEGNTVTPPEFQSEFESINAKLKELGAKYDDLVSKYTKRETILPPSLKLLAFEDPSSAALLENYSRTTITIDAAFVEEFFKALSASTRTFKTNSVYQKIFDTMQKEFPGLMFQSQNAHKQNEPEAFKKLAAWLDYNFESVEALNISKVIVKERQSSDVSYAYLRMLFAFQPLIITKWP